MIKRVKYYTLIKKVGEGGMGTVYKAEDDRNGKIVAIKELDPQKAQIEDYRTRFDREARILTRLNHPNIVAPIEAFANEGTLYIAMEFVDGQSLDYKIRKISGPIPYIHARDLMIKMLEGFSHAHQAGIIHRDIKPANILISDSGDLKITDFGIAKIASGEDRTTANIKLGTLCYMSPEQLTTADVDVRSDIYSLGMTFYEMLAGVLPFTKNQKENPGSLALRISNSEPYPLPSFFYPHIPKRIEDIVMKMLEKDINKRYSSLNAVLNELLQFDLSFPERTLMEDYEKTVAFDPTILTQGKRSDSDVSASSASSSLRNKPLKEMTWEERQQRAKILEEELRETQRQKKEEEQRRIEEEKKQEEEDIERSRTLRDRRKKEQERKINEDNALRKKWELRIGVGIISAYLLVFGSITIDNYLKKKQLAEEKVNYEPLYTAQLKNIFVTVEGKAFTAEGQSWSKFEVGKIEVTQELWESVMGNNPSRLKGGRRPVEQVSWNDIIKFCNKLSEQEGLQKAYSVSRKITCDFNSNGYRLPTEDEWEYAARGGSQSKGYEFSGSNTLKEVGWFGASSNNGNRTQNDGTSEVGKKQPNELGIYDMSGNVWEWCWDLNDNVSTDRVLRGGGWYDYEESCGVVARNYYFPSYRNDSRGFRIVRTKN